MISRAGHDDRRPAGCRPGRSSAARSRRCRPGATSGCHARRVEDVERRDDAALVAILQDVGIALSSLRQHPRARGTAGSSGSGSATRSTGENAGLTSSRSRCRRHRSATSRSGSLPMSVAISETQRKTIGLASAVSSGSRRCAATRRYTVRARPATSRRCCRRPAARRTPIASRDRIALSTPTAVTRRAVRDRGCRVDLGDARSAPARRSPSGTSRRLRPGALPGDEPLRAQGDGVHLPEHDD